MVGLAARIVLGISLAVLSAGCAWRDRPVVTSALPLRASMDAASPAPALAPPRAPLARPAPLPAISNEPEDFACLDGSQIRLTHAGSAETVSISLDGASPISMHRQDEAGLTAYRAGNLVLRRSGVRIALASDLQSVTVQGGDTLGLIATRIYGDRRRAADIARVNHIENPDLILVGQVLNLPRAERRCRRALFQEASYVVDSVDTAQSRPLSRRAFSPPSARQPDQRRVRATVTDRP